jgi:hypothetical protein
MPHDRNVFFRQSTDSLRPAPRDYRIRACIHRRIGGPQHLVVRNRTGKIDCRSDENACRSFANLRHLRLTADNHFDAGGLGSRAFFGCLSRDLGGVRI